MEPINKSNPLSGCRVGVGQNISPICARSEKVIGLGCNPIDVFSKSDWLEPAKGCKWLWRAGEHGRNQSTLSLLIISNLGKIRRFPKPHESGFRVEGNMRRNQSLLSLLIFTTIREENKIYFVFVLSQIDDI